MIVNDEFKQKLSELFLLCIEVTNENFTAFFEYRAHIDCIKVRVHKNGWDKSSDYDHEYEYDEKFNDAEIVDEIICRIKSLKAESDIKYSPENIEETAKENKAKEIAALKARLEKLEG